MKKIVYLAPVLLLSLIGKGAMADQNTHISHLDEGLMTSVSESQPDQMVQNEDVVASETNKINKTAATHISSLDGNNAVYNTKAAQYDTFNVKANAKTVTNFIESKVANDDGNQHTINNPNEDQIIVHYVDESGATIAGLKDYTIDINNAPKGNSTGQFKVPDNRYALPDPTSDYQLHHDEHNVHHDAVTHTVHHNAVYRWASSTIPGPTGTAEVRYTDTGYHKRINIEGGGSYIGSKGDWHMSVGSDGHIDTQPVADMDSKILDEIWDQGKLGPYKKHYANEGYSFYNLSKNTQVQQCVQKAYDETVVDRPAYDETLGNNVFSDNSKNIKSIVGNTVNVILKHGTKNVGIDNSDMELDSWRKVHVINSDNQSNLTNKSVKFKVGYTLDLVSLAKTANFNSSKALSDPNDFIGKNNLTDPVGFSTINTKLLSISL